MVQSALFSQIHYPEVREIDPADQGLEVVPFAVDIYDGSYLVALGQEKYDYSTQYKVIYFPIYLLNRDATKVKSKIGVLEIKTTDLVSAYHGSELDPNRLGEPLWFSFVEERFLNQSEAKLDPQSEILNLAVTHAQDTSDKDMDEKESSAKDLDKELDKPSDKEEDQALELQKPTEKAQVLKPMSETAEEQHLKNGIFETVKETQIPVALPEETEKDNEEAKKAFKKTAKNNWMENYMKNNQYGIVDNEGNGDCFFAVIRDAYKQIGKKTTVAKLRAILAKKVSASVYEQYRELYFNYQGEMESLTRQQKDIAKDHKRLGDIAKKTADITEQKRLVEEGKMKKEQFDKLKVQLRETKELIKEVEFMKGVDSLEKLRHVLQTVTYWADTWAIGVLEKELNMKVILFSEESFKDGAYGNVLLCGQLNEDIPSFSPNFYILSCYTGNHYQLISYKHKYIFGFEEIPYGVKILIVNKCLERNAGAYYVIPEFRELKRQLGIDADEGAPLAAVSVSSDSSDSSSSSSSSSSYESSSSSSSSSESPETETEKYIQKTLDLDPGVVFQFHEKADLKKLPGKGSGEMFPTVGNKKSTTIHTDYTMLSSMPQWRRKLDDSWMGVSSTGVAKSPE